LGNLTEKERSMIEMNIKAMRIKARVVEHMAGLIDKQGREFIIVLNKYCEGSAELSELLKAWVAVHEKAVSGRDCPANAKWAALSKVLDGGVEEVIHLVAEAVMYSTPYPSLGQVHDYSTPFPTPGDVYDATKKAALEIARAYGYE